MRHRIAAAVFIVALTAMTTAGWAGPKIDGEPSPKCTGQPGGSITTVSVLVDPVTFSFYGAQLNYHFTPTGGGSVVSLPTPAGSTNPVQLFVPIGAYSMVINLQATPGGNSQSPSHPIAVAAKSYMVMGSKKMCAAKLQIAPNPNLVPMKKSP